MKSSYMHRRKINPFGVHMAFFQLQGTMYLGNPQSNPLNGFITPHFFFFR